MYNVPKACTTCAFESRCNSGHCMPGCLFYGIAEEKEPLIKRVKNYFGKFFK